MEASVCSRVLRAMKTTAAAKRGGLSSANSALKTTILERYRRILARYLTDWSARERWSSCRVCLAIS